MKQSRILTLKPSADYELVDSGEGEKLERFGQVVLSRPDPQALWRRHSPDAWKKADAVFTRDEKKGDWNIKKPPLDRWPIELCGLKFWIKPTAFKHVGLFPEQAENWGWMKNLIRKALPVGEIGSPDLSEAKRREKPVEPKGQGEGIEILNLFGYTGGATLACAAAGAKVVHVDGSKAALAWARDNADLSGLSEKPVRWILDDAREFVRREVKRGRKYDGIIMDPPSFGHGPDNELWKIEEHFLPLVEECASLLKDAPLFFLINGYSAGYSALAYENDLLPLVERFGGSIEAGELTLEEKGTGRLLPCGIFARWSRK